jgi:uncharacterized membrane protein
MVEETCKANSLVGTRITACTYFFVQSIFSKIGITKEAVFPVPFFALAITSFPVNAIGITSSWTGLGFSYPFS